MRDQSSVLPAGVLETTSEELLELLKMLVHRLSQPLTSLQGSLEVALLGPLKVPECRGIMELSLQESHRMAEALDTLRDVLELESSGDSAQPVSWSQKVEALLADGPAPDRDYGLHLVAGLQEDIWVKASLQHLDAATARLIAGAKRAARGGRLVRVSLSAGEGAARLAICDEEPSPDAGAGKDDPPKALDAPVLGGLEQWVVRRAIERQGGKLIVSQDSEVCCYTLSLPLAMPEIAGQVLS